jgi:hypothetical protein
MPEPIELTADETGEASESTDHPIILSHKRSYDSVMQTTAWNEAIAVSISHLKVGKRTVRRFLLPFVHLDQPCSIYLAQNLPFP